MSERAYVMGVSWPRSGHHLLTRLLKLYFGETFGYCDFYGGIEGCCKTAPCARAGEINFTKSHDFDFALPQIDGQKYLVQYRDFVPSVVSNFELFVRQGGSDSPEGFRAFASAEFGRYRRFLEKWVQSDFAKDQFVLHYDALLADPAGELSKVLNWFDPDHSVDSDRVNDAIAMVDGERIESRRVEPLPQSGVHKSRDVSQFRYYAPALFEHLGRMSLTRQEVQDVFGRVLHRTPSEGSIIGFQTFTSIEALEEHLRASEEFAQLTSTRDATE